MGTPTQPRTLALPLAWGKASERAAEKPETSRIPLSDEQLMEQLRERKSAALEILFDRYSRLVLSIALRILRDYGEAEDIVQEVFFHVFRTADRRAYGSTVESH